MSGPTLPEQVTRFYDLIGGFHAVHLIEVARRLGAWERITAEPGITSARLAEALATDPRYTDVLATTAFALGLVEREGRGWRMAAHFDQILGMPESTFYLGAGARTHLAVARDYADYPARFRDGGTFPYGAHSDDFLEAVAEGLRALPRMFLDTVLPKLPALRATLEGGARVLDVGCGEGAALVEIARRFPKTRCTGVDTEPRSVAAANALIAARGLADRCSARVLGAEGLADDAAYDIVTTFLVIHELAPELKASAFGAMARALVPGGALLIFDEAYPETDEALRTMPSRFAALAQWFELTWGNRVNTRTELLALCAGAGLRVTDETTLSRFTILVATKPG